MSESRAEKDPVLNIRRAGPGDSRLVSSLILRAFSPYRHGYTADAFAYTTPPESEIEKRFDQGPIWIATLDGNDVGTVSGLADRDRFYMRSMAIDPDAQRAGIGQRLLDEFERFAVERGFEKLYLYTTFVLPGARPLYEKNGFYLVRETAPEEWFGVGGIEMEKVLGGEFHIREAHLEDVSTFSEVATRAYLQHFAYLWDDDGAAYADRSFNPRELERQMLDEENQFSLAFLAGTAVGFLKVRPANTSGVLSSSNAYEIERIYLTNDAKGKGIGKAIMSRAIDHARSLGRNVVWLKVMDSNPESIGFYKSLGFEKAGDEELDLPLLKKEFAGMLVMQKDLRK